MSVCKILSPCPMIQRGSGFTILNLRFLIIRWFKSNQPHIGRMEDSYWPGGLLSQTYTTPSPAPRAIPNCKDMRRTVYNSLITLLHLLELGFIALSANVLDRPISLYDTI